MSRALSRSDRVAQIRVQEELIAKKRKEILEKQKTSELGKAVAAAQINEIGKLKKDENIDTKSPSPPPANITKSAELLIAASIPKPTNNFCNDGSFFEHFKKIIDSNKVEVIKEEVVEDENLLENLQEQNEKHEEENFKEELQSTQSPLECGNNSDTNSNSINPNNGIKLESYLTNSDEIKINVSNNDASPTSSNVLSNCLSFLQTQLHQPIGNTFPSPPLQFNPNIPPPNLNVLPSLQIPPVVPATLSIFMQQPPPSLLEVRTSFQSQLQNNEPPPPPPPPPSESPTKMENFSHSDEDEQEDNNCVEPLNILPTSVESLIKLVVENGDAYEEYIQSRKNDLLPSMWFLFDMDSEEYSIYRRSVVQTRRRNAIYKTESNEEKYDPESVCDNDSDDEYNRTILNRNTNNLKRRIETRVEFEEEERQAEEARQKKRKSRWGEKIEENSEQLTPTITATVHTTFANQNKPLLSVIQRTDAALLQYARLNYGTINLTEEVWNKCEEHFKVNLLYQDMMRKRQEIDQLARSGKFKYEYDSDEDIAGGTWEHKLRNAEMEATEAWADALTAQSEGKHHIGDFLPPEELKKFMEQYEAKKNNRLPDLSDYKEYKLKEDNKGFQMLQKLGWQIGQGLGAGGEGIVDPVNKALQRQGNQGLGVATASTPEDCDNEYEAYRKRMMLAYRFRPNPLNNPRRAYY